MTGSKTTSMTIKAARQASRSGLSQTNVSKVRAAGPYTWDGKNEDDRPLPAQVLNEAVRSATRPRGRPSGSAKESTTIRFDREVLDAFRAEGPGWQTRMNSVLRQWLVKRGVLGKASQA